MLLDLLKFHLRPYKKWIVAVVVLQGIQATGSLLLPTLNADIIDKGIRLNDTGYIWSKGGLMLTITVIQLCFTVSAVYFGSRIAMSFGVLGSLLPGLRILDPGCVAKTYPNYWRDWERCKPKA